MLNYYLAIVLAPLAAAIIAGLFGKQIGRAGAHWVTIVAVGLSFTLSALVLKAMVFDGAPAENISLYTWAVTDGLRMEVGFLVDRLSALMMVVVTFVSFAVLFLYNLVVSLFAHRVALVETRPVGLEAVLVMAVVLTFELGLKRWLISE